jgi:hypothetical protein
MPTIDTPGFYFDVTEQDYHADPVIQPSLSSSVAKVLVDQSPRHARYVHPRLRPPAPGEVEKVSRAMDVGSAAHKILLGRGRVVDILQFDDYRKKEAQQMRDDSRRAGNVPVLAADWADVETLAKAAAEQLMERNRPSIFTKGKAEVTMVWQEKNGVWCRSRLDFLPDDAASAAHLTLPELKTTGGSSAAEDWQTTCFNSGYDIQTAFYRRGLKTLLPNLKTVEFEWIVLEQDPPHGLNIIKAGGQMEAEADEMVGLAIEMWGRCTTDNKWPGYDEEIVALDPPYWRAMKAELRRMALRNRMARWQAPL